MKRLLCSLSLTLSLCLSLMPSAAAQIFNGGGVGQGSSLITNPATGIKGIPTTPLRVTVIKVISNILNFLSLVAVIVVVVAGLWLILGFGEDEAKDRAKRMIIHTLIGLAIVFLARVIVALIATILTP